MGNTKMVEILKAKGFINVANTISLAGGTMSFHETTLDHMIFPDLTCAGKFDSNNGTFAIWDGEGNPWIIKNYDLGFQAVELIQEELGCELRQWVYVPHSNDGGQMSRFWFPNREKPRPPCWIVGGRETRNPLVAQLLLLAKSEREMSSRLDDVERGADLIDNSELLKEAADQIEQGADPIEVLTQLYANKS